MFLGVVFGSFSCSQYNSDCDPNYFCNTQPWDWGWIDVELTYEGDPILVKCYEGYVEDNVILHEDFVNQDVVMYQLEVGKRYAFEAHYKNGTQVIIALNGTKLNQEIVYNCEETCYEEPIIKLES